MNADVERALLVLLAQQEDSEVPLGHFVPAADLDVLSSNAAAVDALVTFSALRSRRGVDLMARIQGLVLAVGLSNQSDDEVGAAIDKLAGAILGEVGADPTQASNLVSELGGFRVAIAATPTAEQANAVASAVERLDAVLGPHVTFALDAARTVVTVSGREAATAAMMLEVASVYAKACIPDFPASDPVSGKKNVTYVRIEYCTSLPFSTCRDRIDPIHWTDCNPYFVEMKPGATTKTSDGWYGKVTEIVGPALNYRYYETELKMRYLAQDRIAAVAFDLVGAAASATTPGLDHGVSVDRGFLAVVDEGTHRRLQMLKVYRIEDLKTNPGWVCPLWAQQMGMAGWSCGATVAMRRALKAWSSLARNVVALGHTVCDARQCRCPEHDDAPGLSRAAPLHTEIFEVPLPGGCARSFTDLRAQVRVPVSSKAKQAMKAPLVTQVAKSNFTSASMAKCDAKVEADNSNDAMLVSLKLNDPGLYLGRLTDSAAGVDVPFTLYDAGL